MDSGRLIFDPAPSHHHGPMLILGGSGNPIFRGARSAPGVEEGGSNLRPFFTSPEELLEEEYYDEQLPEKKRRLTPEQVHLLERSFESENKLEPERKSELARKLGLQQRQVAVWFQNRRARWKTKQLERDYDRLKATYDGLVADRDALFKDNDRLRTQVVSLTEKLQAKEIPAEGKPETHQVAVVSATVANVLPLYAQKLEDLLSNGGSPGSTVVDGECPQLVDSSGDSYFQESYQRGCYLGVQSEEDDGSDDGCSYRLPADMFAEHQSTEAWPWVWS